MKKNKYLLDTNILIRFLTNDPKEQAEAVTRLFQKSEERKLFIPDVIIVEIVFVLLSYYELSKEEVIEKLTSLINYEKFNINATLFQKTLELYRKYPISFVDAYVGAMSNIKPNYTLYTFDKKILHIKEIKTTKPPLLEP